MMTSPLPVRLKDGGGEHEGRVEIKVWNEWGTICDNSWDLNDAHVVCRMLGYEGAYQSLRSAHFGAGTGPIFLDAVMCTGNEPNVDVCKHKGLRSHNCDHSKDASVICLKGKLCHETFSFFPLKFQILRMTN